MRLFTFVAFLVVITPIEIWLDFVAGIQSPNHLELFTRPFAQAAFYIYAAAIGGEVIFRVSNMSGHFDVGAALKIVRFSALALIVYLVADYVQVQRPKILDGQSIANTAGTQLLVAFVAILISSVAYLLEDRRKDELGLG